MRCTGRRQFDDEKDVMEITNEKCAEAEILARSIFDETSDKEDQKTVLRNVINTLIEKL